MRQRPERSVCLDHLILVRLAMNAGDQVLPPSAEYDSVYRWEFGAMSDPRLKSKSCCPSCSAIVTDGAGSPPAAQVSAGAMQAGLQRRTHEATDPHRVKVCLAILNTEAATCAPSWRDEITRPVTRLRYHFARKNQTTSRGDAASWRYSRAPCTTMRVPGRSRPGLQRHSR